MSSLIQQERERVLVYHVNGDGTNQDTLLCCRVWSEPQVVHKLQPRCRPCTSWFVSWSPAHRSQSTDSMTTIPPTAHALRTPTNMTHKKTWGMRVERGKEGEGVEHPIAGRRVWEWEKREIKWWAHSFKKRRRKNTKEVTLWPPGNPPNYKGKDRLSMKQHLHVTNMNKWKLGMDTGIWSHAARIKTRK